MSEEVRIIITDDTSADTGDAAPVSTGNGGASSTQMAPKDEKSAKRSQKAGAAAMGLVAVREIAPFISQAVNFRISQMDVTSGNLEAQRKAQAYSNMAGTGISIVAAGVSGGGYAAAAAAAMAAIQGITSAVQRYAEIQNQKRLENENLALRKSRLGLATNRSRTGGVS